MTSRQPLQSIPHMELNKVPNAPMALRSQPIYQKPSRLDSNNIANVAPQHNQAAIATPKPVKSKKEKQKISALCKTPPSTIKAQSSRGNRNFKRGYCLGQVRVFLLFRFSILSHSCQNSSPFFLTFLTTIFSPNLFLQFY